MASRSGSAADSPSIVQTSPSSTPVECLTRIWASAVTRGSLTLPPRQLLRFASALPVQGSIGMAQIGSHHGHEQGVDAAVVRELRVECDREHAAVANRHRMAVGLGQDFHSGPVVLDPRGADENGPQRLLPDASDGEVGLEALALAAEGVAAATVIGETEVFAVADDHSRRRSRGSADLPRDARGSGPRDRRGRSPC